MVTVFVTTAMSLYSKASADSGNARKQRLNAQEKERVDNQNDLHLEPKGTKPALCAADLQLHEHDVSER